ncbi:hypothetical protein [Sphingomonas sp. LHG3406-1]|uniref:hypothetical protein n=1 Tax=Sphingomonas sp. LHG3406-1 TaxID=2804617 RepID=UPI002628A373|nr:hypothetical protein [Sphingomonas sp. LHG3406-1]
MRLEKVKERQVSEEKKKPGATGKEADNRNFKAGIAVGIGSAAIVAALLYARSGKPKKK